MQYGKVEICGINTSELKVLGEKEKMDLLRKAQAGDKQARDDWERAENARLKREIGRLEDAARRTASWSDRVEAAKKGCRNSGLRPDRGYLGHKAQKMMRRSKAVEARRTEAAEAKAGASTGELDEVAEQTIRDAG